MHPALWRLLNLRLASQFRRLGKSVRTPKGAIFAAVGFGLACVWLAPAALMAFHAEPTNPETVRTFVRWALLVGCLSIALFTSGADAVFFHPAEIDFLFSGPFTRKQLLRYKITEALGAQGLSALFLSVILLQHATHWIACFLGAYLALLFLQLFNMAQGLLRQTIAKRAYTRGRKLLLTTIAVLLVVGALHALAGAGAGDLGQWWTRFRASPLTAVVLAPFSTFANTMTAEVFFPNLVGWATAALGVDLALIAIVLRLDANYNESAIATSQKRYARLQNMRRGQLWSAAASPGRAHWRLPRFPWLAGAGPIAWRQLTGMMRTSGKMVLFLFVLLLAIGGLALAPVLTNVDHKTTEQVAWVILVGAGAQLTLLLLISLRYDFRGDIDHLVNLKALPLRASAIAAGQLAAPVLVLTTLQSIAIVIAAVLTGRAVVGLAILFVVPINVLLVGLENTFFLLFPNRAVGTHFGHFQQMGRQIIVMLAELLTMMACLSIAAGFGALAYWLLGESPVALVLVSWLLLTAESSTIIPLVAWAFRRFDVSADMPG